MRSSKPGEKKERFAVSLVVITLTAALSYAAELQPDTLEVWNHYIEKAKARMNSRLDVSSHFLWVNEEPDRVRRLRSGEILVAPVIGGGRTEVPNGLIHNWIGAAFFPDTTIEKVFTTDGRLWLLQVLLCTDGNCLQTSFARRLRKQLFDAVTEESTRNESEPTGGLDTNRPKVEPFGSGRRQHGIPQADRRGMSLRRGGRDSTVARTCRATGETVFVPPVETLCSAR
jgi:hypothetical protein